jgi:acyl-CoA thioesterase I
MNLLKKLLAPCLLCLFALPASAQNILVVGDSISAAFGLGIEEGWVHMLQERLEDKDYPYQVVNASVSGDTTAGGLARLPRLLEEHEPVLVVIELGGNDGLRGMPPGNMQQNLSQMVELSSEAGADAIILGMMIPPNYGMRYTQAFNRAFVEVAEAHSVPLLPFLLEGVGDVPELMQADRIHPTAEAQPILLENAWPLIRDWLSDRYQGRQASAVN